MARISRRLLIAPAALAGAGLAAFLLAPLLAESLHLPPDSTGALFLHHAFGIWMWLALAWLAARVCDLLLHRVAILSRGGAPYPALLSDLVSAALFAAAGLTILMQVFDKSANGLITVSSVMIAVIGFALRNVISDIFSGIALGIDHPYAIGDWIETVQGAAGKVSEITWRTTRLVDRNGFVIIVPNGLVAGQRLINYGADTIDYRTALRVPLDAALPAARAKRILLSGALDAERRFPGLAPDVLLSECGDGAASYLVRFRVPDFGGEAVCRDTVASCVLNALNCAGQTIQRSGLIRQPAPPWRSPREALLSNVDLFRGFDPQERAELAAKMRARELEAGETVVRQGDEGDCVYLLAEGILDVLADRPGMPPIRDRIAPGEVFGEMSLLTGQQRSATVSAALISLVYEIHRRDLDPILHRRPEIAEGLAAVMAEHQARNERLGRVPEEAASPTRADLLARLRLLFRL
jgi:small-conductance mechanosensitive channel/CRP-like cAMP-binding protein